jgi:Flp pilus assembly protein TadG
MKSNKLAPKKNTAQAMVEFAIVLPILLLLLYGLLEAGRLLFMYSSIVTASRQASRYGATTGAGTGGVPRYQDCAGIRLAANKVDYLNSFDHTTNDVQIFYDTGPSTSQTAICAPGTPSQAWPATNNTRIVVRVTGHFNPIVRLVPFPTRNIVSTSGRTILVSVSIAVDADAPETPTITIAHAPNPSEVGQTVPVIVTVSGGSGIPAGTVDILVEGSVICNDIALNSSGIANCNIEFYADSNISVVYTSTSVDYTDATSGNVLHDVGKAPTTTEVEDVPSITKPGVATTVTVTVRNIYDPTGSTIIPTGTVIVTNSEGGTCGTLTLNASGVATCSMIFNIEGFPVITATYSGDANHDASTGTETHQVLLADPTPTNTPVPPTAQPTVPPGTAVPTPVSNCNSIRDAVNTINFSTNTMYLNIPNANGYPVTIGSIYVAWNYDKGHIGSNSNLKLMNVTINSTTIWSSATGIHQPSYTITSFSNPAVIPASGTSKLTFTFDQSYNRQSGEQIQFQLSTPGCESYPVLVPVGATTPVPPPNLNVQLISGGTDNNQQTQFRYQIQNRDVSAVSNISVRVYFTLDGSNAASSYVMEKFWDQSNSATVTGPALASGSIYYFTVSYGTASLAAGSVWEYQGALHLSSWASTFDSTNDWWHGTGALPGSWTDWTRIPLYVNSSLVVGSPP